jgi:heterodisulfide reductase subunit A
VEKGDDLGGTALKVHYTLEGHDPQKYLLDLREDVQKHPLIHLCTNSRVSLSRGSAGRFQTMIASEDEALTLEHGVTVLATGGHEFKPYDFYGYGSREKVMTQSELEKQIASGQLNANELQTIAMIQCVGSREEPRNYCSRICCSAALKNALKLKSRNPELNVYIFYRDIMSYGFAESYYTQARKLGVTFIRYDPEQKPAVSFEGEKPVITALDPILGKELSIALDLLILSTGIVPNEADELAEIFGVPVNQDGFFEEAEPKWRPVEFFKQGIYLCGLAHSPRNMPESIASAKAAAQSALRILARKEIKGSRITAEVKHTLCALCARCVEACPYEARYIDTDQNKIVVDSLLCQGCGCCAAVCPNSASILKEFQDAQIMSEIDAALGYI